MLTATAPPSTQAAARSLAPAPGVTAPPTEGASYRFLSDVIIARGLVEPSAMKAALQASLAGRSLTELLVDHGHLGEDDLARTLAEHHRLDHVDLDDFYVDPDVAGSIEPDVARRFGAVPIAMLPSGAIVVALHDPNGSTAALEFARQTGRPIQPAVASRTQIEALIDELRRGRTSVEDMPRLVTATPVRPAASEVVVCPSIAASPAAAPAVPGPIAPPQPQGGVDLDFVRRRAEIAEQRLLEAEQRARAAEELTRLAEARARASEERAQAAGERAGAAEVRGAELSPVAGAANDALARLVRACEVLEREAQARGPEADVLRTLLETERAQRMALEAQVRSPPDTLQALLARVAELERVMAAPPAQPSPPEATFAEPPPPEATFAEPPPEEPAAEAPPEITFPEPPPEATFAEPPPEEPSPPELATERHPVKARRRRGLFGPRRR